MDPSLQGRALRVPLTAGLTAVGSAGTRTSLQRAHIAMVSRPTAVTTASPPVRVGNGEGGGRV